MTSILRRHGWEFAALALFFIAYLLPLGGRPMLRPDEFRYAEIPREMLATGDWTVPRLSGVRYFEKPALGYQLTALSFRIFGENEFALRLPSALAVGLAALFLYFLVRKVRADARLAAQGALAYLACSIVLGVGTFAVLDSQLSAALTLTVGGFYLAWRAPGKSETCFWLLFAGAAAGAAFLLKGFLAIAIPGIVIVPFLIWQRDWKKLLLYPWLPLFACLAVALPWSLQIAVAEPDFWRYFFVEEHLNRFLGETYDRKPQPFWYFLPVLAGGILPPGLLAVAGYRGWTKTFFRDPFHRFLLLWAAIPFVFFSASSCKLGTYILPCFPPLALLLALGFAAARQAMPETVHRRLATTMAVLAAVTGLVGIAGIAVLCCCGARLYTRIDALPFLAMLALLGWSLALWRLRRSEWATAVLLAGFAPAVAFGMYAFPDRLVGKVATANGLRSCFAELGSPDAQTMLIVERSVVQPTAWVTGRTDIILCGRMGELEYGLSRYPQEYAGRHYPEDETAAMLAARRPPRALYIRLDRRKGPEAVPFACRILREVSRYGVTISEIAPRQ